MVIGLLASLALACGGSDCTRAAEASAVCADRTAIHYAAAENVLCINGPIDVEGRMRDAVIKRDYRPRLIVVARSDGGSLAGAIDMAEHLRRFRYSIVVDGICASACAQFLFMAAEQKVIRADGIVAMHGGPFTDEQIEALDLTPEGRENIRRESDRFVQFYRKLGIGIGITNDFPPRLREQLARGEMVFWIPKEADFRRFNVSGLAYCNARYRDPENVAD